jgi:hypothetical protein
MSNAGLNGKPWEERKKAATGMVCELHIPTLGATARNASLVNVTQQSTSSLPTAIPSNLRRGGTKKVRNLHQEQQQSRQRITNMSSNNLRRHSISNKVIAATS